jgi:hypothetical protein
MERSITEDEGGDDVKARIYTLSADGRLVSQMSHLNAVAILVSKHPHLDDGDDDDASSFCVLYTPATSSRRPHPLARGSGLTSHLHSPSPSSDRTLQV